MTSGGTTQRQTPKQRKLFLLCKELGLDRTERMEVARYLLRRDLYSFQEATEEQVDRLLDAFEGAQLVIEQYRQRP